MLNKYVHTLGYNSNVNNTGMADLSDTSHWCFNCVCVCVRAGRRASVWVCVSEDMSPYCSAHDEWLIMKLSMYFGYHDANNVSNFCGDQVTQLIFRNVL